MAGLELPRVLASSPAGPRRYWRRGRRRRTRCPTRRSRRRRRGVACSSLFPLSAHVCVMRAAQQTHAPTAPLAPLFPFTSSPSSRCHFLALTMDRTSEFLAAASSSARAGVRARAPAPAVPASRGAFSSACAGVGADLRAATSRLTSLARLVRRRGMLGADAASAEALSLSDSRSICCSEYHHLRSHISPSVPTHTTATRNGSGDLTTCMITPKGPPKVSGWLASVAEGTYAALICTRSVNASLGGM